MENEVLVSAIMPVYNSEEYLEKTLDSLVNQTLREIEIICVNDASTDNSLEIINEYKKKDKRIKVINNQINMGAAVSRNTGLENASGKYVIFLDADDFFYPHMCKQSFETAENFKSDIVIFGYETYEADSYNENVPFFKIKKFKNKEITEQSQKVDLLYYVNLAPWNKLVNREMLIRNNIKFQDIPNANDVYFSVTAMLSADKIMVLEDVLLKYYLGNKGSLTSDKKRRKNHIVEAYEEVYRFVDKNGYSNKNKAMVVNYVITELLNQIFSKVYDETVKEDVYNSLRNSEELVNAFLKAKKNNMLMSCNITFVDGLKKETPEKNKYYYYSDEIKKILKRAKEENKKVALWGYGNFGKSFLEMLKDKNLKINYIIDEDTNKQGQIHGEYIVNSYNNISEEVDIIFVLNPYFLDEIKERATEKEIVDVWKM